MAPDPALTFLSIHVMKTAGTTVGRHIDANFPRSVRYPNRVEYAAIGHKLAPSKLAALPDDERNALRCLHVHHPAFVADRFGPDTVKITVVRDPVDRAASHLRQVTQAIGRTRDAPIDPASVLGVPEQRQWLFANHQVRVFGLAVDEEDDWSTMVLSNLRHTTDDERPSPATVGPVEVDRTHLEPAKERLSTFDLVGTTEHLDGYLAHLASRWGWTIEAQAPRHVTEGPDLDPGLRQELDELNQLDRELYEFVLDR